MFEGLAVRCERAPATLAEEFSLGDFGAKGGGEIVKRLPVFCTRGRDAPVPVGFAGAGPHSPACRGRRLQMATRPPSSAQRLMY